MCPPLSGLELDITTPDLSSLRALYARDRTLFDPQQQACEALGFAWMTEHQRRALVRILRDEVIHRADRERLLLHARHWLYEHRLLIVHDRVIRGLVAAALNELEPHELIGHIAPTRLEGINLRGAFRFPLERYAGQILPSQTAAKTSASG